MTRAPGSPFGPDEDRFLRIQVKRELRRRLRAIRGQLPAEARAARSAAIVDRVLALPELRAARSIAAFVAMRSEADPAGIVAACRARGHRVALPRVHPEPDGLVLHAHAADDPLERSSFGVLEPSASAPRVDAVDVVIVPGLAFDPRGHRIGYGKGFYDRLLPTLPGAFRCAIAYDFQLVPEVPDRDGDVPVHAVVTDRRVLRCPDAS